MKLKLYSVGKRYAFNVGGFSSLHHSSILPDGKQTYSYAWEAYKDARKMGINRSHHVLAIRNRKYAVEDLTEPLVMDASGEEMIQGHYQEVINILEKRAEEDAKDKKKHDMVYEEIKGVVTELLAVKEKFEGDSNKKKISELISKIRSLVRKKFPKQLAKDIADKNKEEAAAAAAPPPAPPAPAAPAPGQGQPQDAGAPQGGDINLNAEIDCVFKRTSALDLDVVKEMVAEYGDRVCRAIQEKHPKAICKINKDNSEIEMVDSGSNSTILRVCVNKNLNVDKIIPCGELSELFPLSSLEFYQRYWKPIVQGVGHFFVENASTLLAANKISLPDIPKSCPQSHNIKGWNTASKKEEPVVLWFRGKDPTWEFEAYDKSLQKEAQTNQTKTTPYTEEDFIKDSPKRVMCIDKNLKSIYGKIGEVTQVVPTENRLFLDINFGRSIVRLSGDQVRIVNDVQANT